MQQDYLFDAHGLQVTDIEQEARNGDDSARDVMRAWAAYKIAPCLLLRDNFDSVAKRYKVIQRGKQNER